MIAYTVVPPLPLEPGPLLACKPAITTMRDRLGARTHSLTRTRRRLDIYPKYLGGPGLTGSGRHAVYRKASDSCSHSTCCTCTACHGSPQSAMSGDIIDQPHLLYSASPSINTWWSTRGTPPPVFCLYASGSKSRTLPCWNAAAARASWSAPSGAPALSGLDDDACTSSMPQVQGYCMHCCRSCSN